MSDSAWLWAIFIGAMVALEVGLVVMGLWLGGLGPALLLSALLAIYILWLFYG